MFTIDKKWIQLIGFSCILFMIFVGVALLRTSSQKEVNQEKEHANIVQEISNQYKIKETVQSLKGTKWILFSSDDSLAYDIRSGLVNYKEFDDDLNRERALQAEHGDPIKLKGFLEFYDDTHFQFRTDIFRQKSGEFEKSVIYDFSYVEDPKIPGILRSQSKNGEPSGGWIKIISPHFIVSRIKYGDMIFVREGYENLCVDKKDILNKKLIKYYELESYYQYKKSGKVVRRLPKPDPDKGAVKSANTNQFGIEDFHYDYNNFLVSPRYFVRSDGYLDGIPGLESYAGYADDEERSTENFKFFKQLLEQDISKSPSSDPKEEDEKTPDFMTTILGLQEMVCCSLENLGIPGNALIMYKSENDSPEEIAANADQNTDPDSQCFASFDFSTPYAKSFFVIYPQGFAIECKIFHDISGKNHIMASEIYILVD